MAIELKTLIMLLCGILVVVAGLASTAFTVFFLYRLVHPKAGSGSRWQQASVIAHLQMPAYAVFVVSLTALLAIRN